jgi:hypothetical protein
MNDDKPDRDEDDSQKSGEQDKAGQFFIVPGEPGAAPTPMPATPALPSSERPAPKPPEQAAVENQEPEGADDAPLPPENLLTEAVIDAYRESAKFTVGLIGFPGAGKTFFLNRLKYSYHQFEFDDGRSFHIDPSYDDEPVGPTTFQTYHEFTRLSAEDKEAESAAKSPGGSDRDFVLFDLPGELFLRAITSKLRGAGAAELGDAMAACDALILVLPADVLFGSRGSATEIIEQQLDAAEAELEALPEAPAAGKEPAAETKSGRRSRRKPRVSTVEGRRQAALVARRASLEQLIDRLDQKLDDQEGLAESDQLLDLDRTQLSKFVANITNLVTKVAVLKRTGLGSAEFDALGKEESSTLIRQTALQTHAPLIYVAISKADALLSAESPIIPLRAELAKIPRDEIDLYPFEAAAACERGIYQGITSNFRWYRFDFLTSFEGQSHDLYGSISETDTRAIRYNLPNFGVTAIIDWLEFAKAKSVAIKRRGWSRFLHGLGGSAPQTELRLARRAEQGVARAAGFHGRGRGISAMLAKGLLTASPGLVRTLFIGLLAVVLILGLVTTGMARALSTRWLGGDSGGYQLTLQPRYPSEAALLRESNPRFKRAFATVGAQPWAAIPDNGGMFAVPRSRPFRRNFDSVLDDIRRLPSSGPILSGAGQSLIDRLNGLQGEMNRDYAADAGGNEAGLHRERSFINYHIGYVQLRMEAFDDAATSFASTVRILDQASPDGSIDQGRLLGVKIATHYAYGLALLQTQREAELIQAVAELDTAIGLLPAIGSADRIKLTPDRTHLLFQFDSQGGRTPASLAVSNLYTDALAAHIRAFQPTRDLAPGSALSLLVDELARHRNEIPHDHPLAANYLIAAALLGKPLGEVRIAIDDIPDPAQRGAAVLAMRALGQAVSLGDGTDFWSVDRQVRDALMTGNADALAHTLDGAETSDRAALDTLVREAIAAQRQELARSQRGPLIAGFGQYMGGTGFFALANDLSPVGGLLIGTILWLLLLFGFLWLCLVYRASRRTFGKLSRARHFENRKDAAAKAEQAAAAPPAEGTG